MLIMFMSLSFNACNDDEPWKDNPKEIEAKKQIIESAFKKANAIGRPVTVCVYSGGTVVYVFKSWMADVKFEGELVYFGNDYVTRIVLLVKEWMDKDNYALAFSSPE